MNKLDLTRSFAKKSQRTKAEAADAVDSLVHRLIQDLKESQKIAKEELSATLTPRFPRPVRES
jgi:nucleoid DNA-binding protein